MEALAMVFLGLLCAFLFVFLCLFLWFWYQAYRLRNGVDKILKKEGKDLISKGLAAGASKLEEKINKKNQK